jgi:hypothetical protein
VELKAKAELEERETATTVDPAVIVNIYAANSQDSSGAIPCSCALSNAWIVIDNDWKIY